MCGSEIETDRCPDPGKIRRTNWNQIRLLPRAVASREHVRTAPREPGVYIWFREDEPVYLGKAAILRDRLGTHRRTSTSPSKSTLRATVGAMVTGQPRKTLREKGRYVEAEAQVIDTYLDGCELAWVTTATPADAALLERSLINEWRPPLNLA